MEYFTSTLHGYEPIFVGAGCLALGYMYGRHCRSMLLENVNSHTESSDAAAADCINHVTEEEFATPPSALIHHQHDPARSPSISAWNYMDVEKSERCGKRIVGQLEIFQMPRAKEDSLWAQSSAFKKQKGVPLITIQRKEQDSDDVPLARRMEYITNRSASINKPGGCKLKKKTNKKGKDHVTMSKTTTMTRSRSGLRELANPHDQQGECSLDDTCRSPKPVKDDGGGDNTENVAQEMELNRSLRDESVGLMDSQCELYEEPQCEHDVDNSVGDASMEKGVVEDTALEMCELNKEPQCERNVDLPMVDVSTEKCMVEDATLRMCELQEEPRCEHDADNSMGGPSMEKCIVEDAALRMCELNEEQQCEHNVDPPLADASMEECMVEDAQLQICELQEEPQCMHNVDPPATNESMEKRMVEDMGLRMCELNEEPQCEHNVDPPISDASMEKCAVEENALRMCKLNEEPQCEYNVDPPMVDAIIKKCMVEDATLRMCELQEEPQCEYNVDPPIGDACMENCIVEDSALQMETLDLEQQSLPPPELHEDRNIWKDKHEVEKEHQVHIDKVLKVEIYELLHAADYAKVSFEEIVSLLEEKLKVVLREDRAHIVSLVREVINISKLLEEE